MIAGDLLVDAKTTKKPRIRPDHLDQLHGYFMLARRARRSDWQFPGTRRAALYFARRAKLCTLDASVWTDQPHFCGPERLFFARADAARDDDEP